MTTSQKRQIIERIAEAEADLSTMRRVRMEVAASGFASASLASGGGSKSYTRLDLARIIQLISAMEKEVMGLRKLLAPASAVQPSTTYTVYS
jgi:hypothetical protein